MAKVEQKQPIVAQIAETVKGAKSAILVQYSGINVANDTELRKELREAGITYKVCKNTMMRFAFKGTEFEPLCDHLEGPNALAVSMDDATAPARIIAKYFKKAPTLKMIGAVVEGKYYDEKGCAALSAIPSREELLAKLFGSMKSPVSSLARLMSQIAENKSAE